MQHTKTYFYIFFVKTQASQKRKKTSHTHSFQNLQKAQNTGIYIKNKFPKAKLYSHKIHSVHLNLNPITKKITSLYAQEDHNSENQNL
jgi:hypothetical protein